jgi:hypothetical protein
MRQPRRIAVVSDMEGLHAAVRKWVDELQVSRETIDAVSGLQSGYSGKLLSPVPGKTFGRTSLGLILGATGLDLWVVVNDEKLAKVQSRLTKANETGARMLSVSKKAPTTIRLSRRHMDKIRKLATEARKKIPDWKRKEIASNAARARWGKTTSNPV